LSAASHPPLFSPVQTPSARSPDTTRLRQPRVLPAARPPFFLFHTLRFGSKPPSASTRAGRRLTSPHRTISPKVGAMTTPSSDECHCSLPRCPSFVVELGHHLRRAHPTSTHVRAVHRAGNNRCSPPSTGSHRDKIQKVRIVVNRSIIRRFTSRSGHQCLGRGGLHR
jgi:hypothetical protein